MIAISAQDEFFPRHSLPEEPEIVVRSLSLATISLADRQRWMSLAARTLDPNPFLTPEFVEPLCEGVVDPGSVVMLAVQESATTDWVALGLFQRRPITPSSPLPSLQSLQSDYGFLDGLLVDRDQGTAAVNTLMAALARQRCWHGLQFPTMREDSPVSRCLDAASESLGIRRFVKERRARAAISLESSPTADALLASCSKSRRKSLRRARRRLESAGELKFQLHTPAPDESLYVDEFLRLERLGWKGEAGTALAGNQDLERFFRAVVRGFSKRGDAWFGRLLINDRVIASTCNFRAGETLYAFKIGWDPEFADGSPGLWSEIELAVAARQRDPSLVRIDSCSRPGSYLESVWPHPTAVCSASYEWSRRSRMVSLVRQQLRPVKRLVTQER